MALTKIQQGSFAAGAIQTADLSSNTTAAFATSASVAEFATSLAPKVTSVNVANSSFAVLDDTAVNVGGGYIVITGTNFAEGVTVLVDITSATSVSRINSTTLRVQVPPKAAATYNLFVVNPDGGTGIRVSGITYSATPTWVTASPLNNSPKNSIINFSLNATGANTYALAAGSTLPAGTALLANGYFYGTPTGGETDISYSFVVVATDTELQDSPKTFAITITAVVPTAAFFLGYNNFGVSGISTFVDYRSASSPTQVGSLLDWDSIATAQYDMAAIKQDSTLWSWGYDRNGKQGRGVSTESFRSSPTQVGSDTNWKQVGLTITNTIALKKTGTLWRSGPATVLDYANAAAGVSTFSQIGSISNWKKFDTPGRGNHIMALKEDDTLWTWGVNSFGQLGLNDTVTRSSPVQIGSDTWKEISMEGSNGTDKTSTMAIKTNGTMWAWGSNADAGLGLNDKIDRSSPVQVGTGTNWSTINVSARPRGVSLATKTDGTLWSWGGLNNIGQLGLGDSIARSSPTQVGALTNWLTAKSMGHSGNYNIAVYAIKTNGTLWAWGNNTYGFLGQNISGGTIYNSPVQVGTSTGWKAIHNKSESYQCFFLTREIV